MAVTAPVVALNETTGETLATKIADGLAVVAANDVTGETLALNALVGAAVVAAKAARGETLASNALVTSAVVAAKLAALGVMLCALNALVTASVVAENEVLASPPADTGRKMRCGSGWKICQGLSLRDLTEYFVASTRATNSNL